MFRFFSILLCFAGCLLTVSSAYAQSHLLPEYPRRFTVDGSLGVAFASKGGTDGGIVPLQRWGSTSNSGLVTALHAEYCFPGSPFSVKAGYEHEEINMLHGDVSNSLSELMAGGRWYMAPNEWLFQPFLGGDVLYAPGADRGSCNMQSSSMGYTYRFSGVANMPRVSLGPVVGADIYVFSCVALQLTYSYRFGIDSKVSGVYTDNQSSHTTAATAHVNRHVLTMGLKVTFPFTFNRHDTNILLRSLLDEN